MQNKYVPPSVTEQAFNCPHCGVLTTQFWHRASSSPNKDNRTPPVWTQKEVDEFDFSKTPKDEVENLKERLIQLASGAPFLVENSAYKSSDVANLNLSKCYNCKALSLWVYDTLIWPTLPFDVLPNADLSEEIKRDFVEASSILPVSARGAAALLRLCVQRLCVQLGEKGKNIDEDIAALVKKGLDVRVQQALDVVRVVGNNAVHPGQIDLRDDRSAAEKLFGLVNLIADIMISQPKHIAEMFGTLPEGARQAISRRDTPKQIAPPSDEPSD